MIESKLIWYSISEKLPDKDGRYLVKKMCFSGEEYVDVIYFAKKRQISTFPYRDIKDCKNVWYKSDSEWGDIPIETVKYWAEI